MEYTLYLEEDCPDKVVYYVFIDQSGLTPQQWIEWRQKFHGRARRNRSMAPTKSKLDTACTAGCGVGAELRFVQVNGDLMTKSPEAFLLQDLKFAPIYDLNKRQEALQIGRRFGKFMARRKAKVSIAQRLTGYGIIALLGLISIGLLVRQARFNPAVRVALRAPLPGRTQAASGPTAAATAALIPGGLGLYTPGARRELRSGQPLRQDRRQGRTLPARGL